MSKEQINSKNEAQRKPNAIRHYTDEYERDLNPHEVEGQNIGSESLGNVSDVRYASDIKELRNELAEWSVDSLREIPIVPEGRQLKEGAVYINLRDPSRREFKAHHGMQADERNWYVPKAEVPYSTWNRLIGIDNPERTP